MVCSNARPPLYHSWAHFAGHVAPVQCTGSAEEVARLNNTRQGQPFLQPSCKPWHVVTLGAGFVHNK